MNLIIDRFEGKYAVCQKENREMINIERIKIPPSAVEGDVLSIFSDTITINIEETKKRRKEIEELTKDLWN